MTQTESEAFLNKQPGVAKSKFSRSIPNPVSGASDSLNELTGLAIVNFASKPLNVDVYQITLGIEMIFPNMLAELCPSQHTARSAH